MEESGWVCRALTEEEVANLPATGDADENIGGLRQHHGS